MPHHFNGTYTGEQLTHLAFPLGGIGAGMICLEGLGGFADLSIHHQPEVYSKPPIFAAICVKGCPNTARVLEGPVPAWRIFGPSFRRHAGETGNGAHGSHYGLPRCTEAMFQAQFPFAEVSLTDQALPCLTTINGWSPFIPGDADNTSLPVAALEYQFSNPTDAPLEAVFSFHAGNVTQSGDGARGVARTRKGFQLWQEGTETELWQQGSMIIEADDPAVAVDCRWFRGGWFDAMTILWQNITDARVLEQSPVSDGDPSTGGSLYVPFALGPGETKTIRIRLSWYVPISNVRVGDGIDNDCDSSCCCGGGKPSHQETYRPWYAGRFPDVHAVNAYWSEHVETLRASSAAFRDAFFDSTLPDEILEAVSANLSILKSPTVMRQTDGRLWCWEGCCEGTGCCHGSCTHVWNYAQAIAHLFPELERSLRQTEFTECQDERGHQNFRAPLPIRLAKHEFHAAADGQLGGIIKLYRDWRISGDTVWLRELWPTVRQSLLYCIDTWDPRHVGMVEEPHHNTYDIEFWGPDGMCTSFYLAALLAATRMAEALGEEYELFATLAERARTVLESHLYNGEYFVQQIQWQGLKAADPVEASRKSMGGQYSPEALQLLQQEGPKYQYGHGCLSDGVLGAWLAEVSGISDVLDRLKVGSHLHAVYQHNLRYDLSTHANPQRPTYALGNEGGLLLCSWPKGGELTLPFVYSNEVWTGIEYQVASHLIRLGDVAAGTDIVRTARARYDGAVRNPFDEYECGHWYGRALSSYALLFAYSGARYDAVERTLYLAPKISGDFQVFLATATGFGLAGVRDENPFIEVRMGHIDVDHIEYTPMMD